MLEVRKVSKIYGRVEALKDVSFRVDREIIGIAGPNGAGKTTLMRILATLVSPTEGEIVYTSGNNKIKEIMGYVPEKIAFYWNRTGLENLEYYASLYGKSIPFELVEMFHLNNRLNMKVREYSKGMVQKLGIVRAFIPSPQILILDEPTSNLDDRARADFLSFVRQYPSDAIVVSSHRLDELEMICDRIIFLNRTIAGEIKLREKKFMRYRIVFENEPEVSPEEFGLERIGSGEYAITVRKREEIPSLIKALVESGARIVEVREEDKLTEVYRRFMNEISDNS